MVSHAIANPRCALWAGMGMGKTSASLYLADGLLMSGSAKLPIVLAPKRVALSTWPDEAKKWSQFSHMKIQPIIGTANERAAALRNFKADLFTINYDNLPWLVETLGDRWPFDMVIADEATRLKSYRVKQGGRRARVLADATRDKVRRWVNLTGTPAPNGLQDLWGQTYFLDFGHRLGDTYSAFESRWFGFQRASQAVNAGQQFVKKIVFPHAQGEIQALLKDICLTLDPKDWFDLDEPIVRTVSVKLSIQARKHYREMEKMLFTEVREHGIEAFSAAGRDIKCLQIASGAMYVDPDVTSDDHPKAKHWVEVHDEKIEALRSIVEEAGGMPVLVAYHFKSDLARIRRAFPTARVLDDRPATITDWNAGEIPILLAHPDSAGHGLNLQDGGNILVYFSHWWALEARQQILERIGPVRQKQSGHDRPVWIYNIVAEDTIDEDVILRIEGKKSVQEVLMDAMKRRGA
jgi:SNF2 family DNA or RNA helicase